MYSTDSMARRSEGQLPSEACMEYILDDKSLSQWQCHTMSWPQTLVWTVKNCRKKLQENLASLRGDDRGETPSGVSSCSASGFPQNWKKDDDNDDGDDDDDDDDKAERRMTMKCQPQASQKFKTGQDFLEIFRPKIPQLAESYMKPLSLPPQNEGKGKGEMKWTVQVDVYYLCLY